ncbi:MAG TPA: hypothetical protein DEB56_14555 [Thiobacillus sp.]|nr:hypothetical protein [Thiobacillus sp.]
MPTLAEYTTRVLDRAGMTNSQVPVTARVEEYINDGLAALDDMLVGMFGHEYRASSVAIEIHSDKATAVGGGALSTAGWLSILSVHVTFSDGTSRAIEAFEQPERDRKLFGYTPRHNGVRYRWVATELQFEPTGAADGLTGLVRYVPQFAAISGAATYTAPNRWDEYAVVSAAIKLRRKLRQDVSDLEGELAALENRIRNFAPRRNMGAAPRFVRRARW